MVVGVGVAAGADAVVCVVDGFAGAAAGGEGGCVVDLGERGLIVETLLAGECGGEGDDDDEDDDGYYGGEDDDAFAPGAPEAATAASVVVVVVGAFFDSAVLVELGFVVC